MIQALMSSVASLQAQQMRMDVIGNDLANIDTTAYKGQDVNFSDLMSQYVSGATGPTQDMGGTDGISYGLGVQVGATTTNMSQGSLTATAVPSDMAIQGNGFFMTSNGEQVSYTRDGSFELDANGNLVSSDTGQELLGWPADASGTVNANTSITPASTLTIPLGQVDTAQATSDVSIGGNLDSTFASTDTGTVTVTTYSSTGAPQDITIQFSAPTAPPPSSPTPPTGATSAWQWTAYSGDSATGTPIGSSTTSGNAPLYFTASGAEMSGLASGAFNTVTLPGSGGAGATTMNLDFSSMESLSSTTNVNVNGQNGFPPGSLEGYSIGQNGVIEGQFTNGLTKELGQVAMASFTNPNGLANVGGNNYLPTSNSGTPQVGTPGSGSLGTVNAGYLESSNVDLSQSLTNLIVTQRGFEANTKMVSTIDQMLQDVIGMVH